MNYMDSFVNEAKKNGSRPAVKDCDTAHSTSDAESDGLNSLAAGKIHSMGCAEDDYAQAEAYYEGLLAGTEGCSVPMPDRSEDQEISCAMCFPCEGLKREDVEAFCEKYGVTPNAFFLSAAGIVLSRFTNSDSSTFTTICSGKSDPSALNTCGMLVNILPVRCRIDEAAAVSDYIKETASQIQKSMLHGIYSFAEISRKFGLQAKFMFAYQGESRIADPICGIRSESSQLQPDSAKPDLAVEVAAMNGSYVLNAEYRSDKYSEAMVRSFVDSIMACAKSMLRAEKLSDVTILSESGRAAIDSFNRTDVSIEYTSVNRLFEAQAKAHPDTAAVIDVFGSVTYDELNRKANRVAHALLKRGLRTEDIIGIIFDRTKEAVIAEYGIMKAGGAFLPMLPDYPDDRIEYCLRDADSPFVLTTKAILEEKKSLIKKMDGLAAFTIEELLSEADESNPCTEIRPENLVYCIYTSGSTGKPKGVMIEHRNLYNFVTTSDVNRETRELVNGGQTFLSLASLSFDVSVMEIHTALCNGKTVDIASFDEIHDPLALADNIVRNEVDVVCITPSFMAGLLEIPEAAGAMRRVSMFDMGAEAYSEKLYRAMRAANDHAVIVNGYGPTEATISCIAQIVTDNRKITIGTPAANVRAYILDRNRRVLPVGAMGELLIVGDGVGRGYRNLPEKTAEVFIDFEGKRAYRSGDLCRILPNGEVEFIGRMDNQVKLRGLRVELDEIEQVMLSYPQISLAKVVVRGEGQTAYLAGFFTAKEKIDTNALTTHLKDSLAAYMVPGVLVQLDSMPLTANGKIDVKALPVTDDLTSSREYVEPATELEKQICSVYAEITGAKSVGATDSFFDIGGTSLTVMKAVIQIGDLGYQIVYKDVFDYPSPRELSARLSGTQAQTDGSKKAGRYEIGTFDYSAIDQLISRNRIENVDDFSVTPLGDIILTGCTGFLGIHILKAYLDNYKGSVWCVTRKGRFDTPEQRLMTMLAYYFPTPMDDLFGKRIFCVDADITDRESLEKLSSLPANTIINPAALVKHFINDDSLDRVNVGGVKNLVDFCIASGKRLVQISTVSTAGDGGEALKDRLYAENDLYFGQGMDNDYIRTKFLGEREVLDAIVRKGLSGCVIRLGNLMSRYSDGEFQINFMANSFMRRLKSYKLLGCVPYAHLPDDAEFSPIDSTAEGVLKLSECRGFTVYNLYNPHTVYIADVIQAMNHYGFTIKKTGLKEFFARVEEVKNDESMNDAILGLAAYDMGIEDTKTAIACDNRFTTALLYRLGFKWPIVDDVYIENSIKALDELGYFQKR